MNFPVLLVSYVFTSVWSFTHPLVSEFHGYLNLVNAIICFKKIYVWIISCLIWISGPFPTTKASKPRAACSCQYICGECANIMATAGIYRCDTGCRECWFLSTQVHPGSSISSISAPAHDGPEQWTWSSKLQWVQHGRAFGYFHYVIYAFRMQGCKTHEL